MRVGFGYGVQKFSKKKSLIIGGITIPYEKGMKGISGTDIMVFAVADALLGAAGLGDIGDQYPDIDEKNNNINSMIFLKEIEKLVNFEKYKISNIDITLVVQKPKICEYKAEMKINIARNLFLKPNQVNVKAITSGKLGFVGKEKGIECYAVALLLPK